MITYAMDDGTTDGGRYCQMHAACNCCDAEQVRQDAAEGEAENETHCVTLARTPDWAPAARPLTRTWRPEQKASGYG